MASLEISLWPQEIQSPMQFCQISNFESQIQLSLKSCHWIILQPSHTLENFEFNSPPQPIQFIHWHTRHTITCQFIPPFFSGKIDHIRSKISPSDFPDLRKPRISHLTLMFAFENLGQTLFCMTFHIYGCKHDTKSILVSILTFSRSRISKMLKTNTWPWRLTLKLNVIHTRGSGKLSSTWSRVNTQMMTSLPSPFTLSSLPLIDRVCVAKACPGRDTNSLLRLCECWPGYWYRFR